MGFDVFRGSKGFIGRWDCFDHTLLEINQIYINEKEIWREKEITQDSETRYIYIDMVTCTKSALHPSPQSSFPSQI